MVRFSKSVAQRSAARRELPGAAILAAARIARLFGAPVGSRAVQDGRWLLRSALVRLAQSCSGGGAKRACWRSWPSRPVRFWQLRSRRLCPPRAERAPRYQHLYIELAALARLRAHSLSRAQVVFETCRKHQDAGVQQNSARTARFSLPVFLAESSATPLTAGARTGARQADMHRRSSRRLPTTAPQRTWRTRWTAPTSRRSTASPWM